MRRLFVISNRVAPVKEGGGATGGLAVAVLEALKERGGVWFGWSGEVKPAPLGPPKATKSGKLTYLTVPLTQQDYDEYYKGYANQSLWPLFHYRIGVAEFTREFEAGYYRVNQLFARRALEHLREDDLIWIHDYHLIPLAGELRAAGLKNRIGFFLHTPFPALEVLSALPNHERLMRALCEHDVIGFQTENDLRAFQDYIRYEARGAVFADGRIDAFGRSATAAVFPIGIDAESFAKGAAQAENTKQVDRLRNSLIGRAMIIGVDRLDYSKGLPQRFAAYERLLENYPENRGRATFLQIAPPSRADVPEYGMIRAELEQMAGAINGRFAEFDWSPLRYLNKSFSRGILSGFLRTARIGLVTPLRDGMNLVAKEYIAAQNGDDPGVLVLSRFAGAARELEASVIVNPFDVDSTAQALQTALAMSVEERRERWAANWDIVRRQDVRTWRGQFLDVLDR